MKKVSILISVVFIVGIFCVVALAQTPDEVIAKADALYNKGDAANDIAPVKEAMALLEGVMEGNEDAAWKFGRASYFVGVRISDKGQKEAIFDKAYKALRPYYDAGTDNIGSNYWFALNAGKYGKLHGILRSLFLVKPMKTACNKVLAKDPSYEDGAAYTILGAIEYEVPGGDLDLCVDYCNKALKYDPDAISSNLYLGKAYYKQDNFEMAKERLEHLIATAKPKYKDEEDDVAEAKELLADVKAELGE
jgi:tetratricopeptide (TPR) repeat protein